MGTSRDVGRHLLFSIVAIGWCTFACALVVTTNALASRADASDRASIEQASQSPDPEVAANALYALAERDDADGAYARAVIEYRASAAKLPSSRNAPRAVTRADLLDAHSEGNFAPYARLEKVRRDPLLSENAEAIDALSSDAEAFPPGLVRIEAWMVCAEAYSHRLGRTDDGKRMLRAVLADAKTDPLTRRQAAHALTDLLVDEGDLDGARAVANASAPVLDTKLARHVDSLVVRRTLRRASIASVAALAILTFASLSIAARDRRLSAVGRALRKSAPLALGFAAYVAIGGCALAAGYERGNASPFLALGAALFPLIIVARAWGAAGRSATIARIFRAIVAASSVAGAAFLLLEWIDTAYLESFGL